VSPFEASCWRLLVSQRFAPPAQAAGSFFEIDAGLPDLIRTVVIDLSADGTTAVGSAESIAGESPFVWKHVCGSRPRLQILDGFEQGGRASAVSEDGSVVLVYDFGLG